VRTILAEGLHTAATRAALFSAQDCCEVLHACAQGGLVHRASPPQLAMQAAAQQHQHQPPQQQRLQGLLRILCARIEGDPGRLPASKLPTLLWSLATLGVVPGQLLAASLAAADAAGTAAADAAAAAAPAPGSEAAAAEGAPSSSSCASSSSSSSSREGRHDAAATEGGAAGAGGLPTGSMWEEFVHSLSPSGLARSCWALATMAHLPGPGSQSAAGFHERQQHQMQQQQQVQQLQQQQVQQQRQQQQHGDGRALASALLGRLEPVAVAYVGAMDNQVGLVLWGWGS